MDSNWPTRGIHQGQLTGSLIAAPMLTMPTSPATRDRFELLRSGVSEEDRALLLGHALMGMPQHYASTTIARVVEAASKVQETFARTTLLRVVNS
jgi:hypothetical protein